MTTQQFADCLTGAYKKETGADEYEINDIKRIIMVGLSPEKPLERRNAAGMIHFFLRKTGLEPDEHDWEKAKELADLYDCRICVDHVAQIYVKGIMDPIETNIFGMRNIIEESEAEIVLEKIFNANKRSPRL